ncbi:small ribosomal subunit protein uS11 [Halyomorpha halys]|uniref:small ribosomal subunit protein uS11 n=1 Tax=Halyomorpha halys TaxID=286706 RepID=UPI0006D4C90B|nr:uncharacterized protein LOC106680341 [Halyomorpha halys]
MFHQLKSMITPNLMKTKWPLFNITDKFRSIHLSQTYCKLKEERRAARIHPKKDDGTEGERQFVMDSLSLKREEQFPDEDTPNKLFDNVPFSQIPICNIKVSKNNTIISITDPKGVVRLLRSCGVEGFKNTRKGTNIAAQATAITIGSNALSKGYSMLRVRLSGLGPGRMSALKGLQMAGLNIISVSDITPVSWHPPRPRKQRRL